MGVAHSVSFGCEMVRLQVYKLTDTPFYIQDDDEK